MNEDAIFATELAQLKKENQQQHETILQLTKELDVFSHSISHDLKAPLRAVTGFTRILEENYKNVLDTEGRRLLNTVSLNARRMNELIDGLLNFSRIGKKSLIAKFTDMNHLVDVVIDEINRTTACTPRIIIGQLHPISADTVLIRQVLTNLIGNAIKFSSKKNDPVIEIQSKQEANSAIYSVQDNGVGFDMRYADKLFSVFQRLHSVEEFEGAGMGLAIVRRIVNLHGGKTWIEAKLDEGTTTYFSIPMANKS